MNEVQPREFVPNQIAKNESIDYIIDLIRKTYVKSTSVVGWYSHRFEGEVRGPFHRWIVPRKVHKDHEHNVADVADEVEYIAAAMNYAPNLVLEIEKLKAENNRLNKLAEGISAREESIIAEHELRIKIEAENAELKELAEGFRCQLVNERNDYFDEHKQVIKLTRQRDIMKKALEFYADRENWRNPNPIIFNDNRSMGHDLSYENPDDENCHKQHGGKTARKALQEAEGIG